MLRIHAVATVWLASLYHRDRRDRGQTAAEYMGIVVIVAIIIVAIATSNIGQTIANNITTKITQIFGAGG